MIQLARALSGGVRSPFSTLEREAVDPGEATAREVRQQPNPLGQWPRRPVLRHELPSLGIVHERQSG